VRLNRTRLKGTDGQTSALTSLAVFYEVLLKMTVIMAPFTPFFAEYLYQRLRKRIPEFGNANLPPDLMGNADSVHYIMLPQAGSGIVDGQVIRGMAVLQQVVELGRRAREAVNISMKTPIKNVTVVCDSAEALTALRGHLETYILEELNAWEVLLTGDIERWCVLSALPNLPVLAKRLGHKTRLAADAIRHLDSRSIRIYSKTGRISIDVNGDLLHFATGDLLVKSEFAGDSSEHSAASSPDGGLTVAVSTVQDDAVRRHGITREFCNRVNKLRKRAKLDMSDQVDVLYLDMHTTDAPQARDRVPISTLEALSHNEEILSKARIQPVPLLGCCGQIIFSDVSSTPGSSILKIALAVPAPTLSHATKAGSEAVEILVATCRLPAGHLRGSLAGSEFDLIVGTDILPSATAALCCGHRG